MAKKKGFFSRYRFVYKPSPILLKCVVLSMLILSIVALSIIGVCINQVHQQKEAARIQAAEYEQKNQQIQWMTENQSSVEGVESIAQEQLGLTKKDTVIYPVVTNQD